MLCCVFLCVSQSLAGLGDVCKKNGSLLLVDTVCSLGKQELHIDSTRAALLQTCT